MNDFKPKTSGPSTSKQTQINDFTNKQLLQTSASSSPLLLLTSLNKADRCRATVQIKQNKPRFLCEETDKM